MNDGGGRPRLAPHVRLTFDPARQRHVLLTPEVVSVLNGTGATIVGHGAGPVRPPLTDLTEQDLSDLKILVDKIS